MTATIDAHSIVYFPIPKVASSSLKRVFYHANHGKPLDEDAPGASAHAEASSTRFHRVDLSAYEGWTKIAVVRDPIRRILSAYTNRVLQRKVLSARHVNPAAAEALGVPLDPGLQKFVFNIDQYRALSAPIRNHTDPSAVFLGPDLGWFDKVYRMEELDALVEYLSGRTGVRLVLPSRMVSETKIDFADLPAAVQRGLREYCAADYGYLRDYYAPL
ncbi:sulfotransferase family protein [Paroceanicella profunda]|uniref:Sulfotransferase family protein n=1 Tax=Paroceanicella profunda TaxID=2579971 RepID=A0A5B8G0V2_9RHOB|nr:sulfotransferase family 2 domain-containing protein [Paroceanicella profunda]QDL93440.1 sulfotransferase family protein [Paroceanicella profunda]